MSKKFIAAIAIIFLVGMGVTWFFNTYHEVTYTQHFLITGKYWKDDSGFSHTGTPSVFADEFWYHVKGHETLKQTVVTNGMQCNLISTT